MLRYLLPLAALLTTSVAVAGLTRECVADNSTLYADAAFVRTLQDFTSKNRVCTAKRSPSDHRVCEIGLEALKRACEEASLVGRRKSAEFCGVTLQVRSDPDAKRFAWLCLPDSCLDDVSAAEAHAREALCRDEPFCVLNDLTCGSVLEISPTSAFFAMFSTLFLSFAVLVLISGFKRHADGEPKTGVGFL